MGRFLKLRLNDICNYWNRILHVGTGAFICSDDRFRTAQFLLPPEFQDNKSLALPQRSTQWHPHPGIREPPVNGLKGRIKTLTDLMGFECRVAMPSIGWCNSSQGSWRWRAWWDSSPGSWGDAWWRGVDELVMKLL
jgi:hypothetical protein